MNHKLPDAFTPFLESLSFKPEGKKAPLVELWKEKSGNTASGEQFVEPAVSLYQQAETQVTMAGFRQKLVQLLRAADHVANDGVADAILGCAVRAASSGSARSTFLNEALARFHKAEVSHFFVFPHSAEMQPVHFDGYRLGETDMPVLKSRCARAKSNFAELYEWRLAGRFALQSPVFNHVVIDFIEFCRQSGLQDNSKVWRDLLLNYFERISRQHFEFMWAHLDRTQVLGAPFNSNFIDVLNYRSLMEKLAQRVTIYLGFSHYDAGYVVPEGSAITLNQPGPDSEVFARFSNHRNAYRLSEVGDSELGRAIFTCAGFCQQAMRFLEAERPDDAALYATICLEHLFTEQKATSDAVCTRTAALTFLRMMASYSEAERELRNLYAVRSAFVHNGKSVKPAQAERLIAYARETLRSLLVLHLKPENRAAGFLDKWVKDLDFIVSGFEAGHTFDDSLLAETGIFKP